MGVVSDFIRVHSRKFAAEFLLLSGARRRRDARDVDDFRRNGFSRMG